MRRRRVRSVLGVVTIVPLSLVGACASFASVRSAEVLPGPSVTFQVSGSSPPGEEAGEFWSYDCYRCNRPVIGGEIGVMYGSRRRASGLAAELGVGWTGLSPYVESYIQLGDGARPFGIGTRGSPFTRNQQYQVYGRYDIPLGDHRRLLLNPAVVVHHRNEASADNPWTFTGFVQGVGLLFEGERTSLTPAIAIVAGRAQRTVSGVRQDPKHSVFATLSLNVNFHSRREPRTLPPGPVRP